MGIRSITQKVVGCVVLATLVVSTWSARADEVTLTAAADTFIDEYNPNSAFGSSDRLCVAASWSQSGDDNFTRVAFLRFDYSSIPVGSTIEYAELRLTRIESGWPFNPGVNLGVSGLTNPNWSESSLTWNNAPGAGVAPIGTLRLGTTASWVWRDTDFDYGLSYVIDKVVNDYSNFSDWKTWALRGADWGCGQLFATRENATSSIRPKLYVRFTPPPQPLVSGWISLGAQGAGDVVIALSNGGGSTQPDSSGNWSIRVPYGWSGTITPSKPSWGFLPLTRSLSSVTADQSGQDFQLRNVMISGYVRTSSGAGVANVRMDFSNLSSPNNPPYTDSTGYYFLTCVPNGWSGTVTPSMAGTSFSPTSRSYTITDGNYVANQDYTATPLGSPRIIRLDGDLAFGSVQVGSSAQRTLRMYNDGNSTLSVSGISCPSGFSGAWSGTIGAGAYRDVTVAFSPSTATTYSGDVVVSSDATSGSNTKAVSGTGTPQGGATHGLLGQYYNDTGFSDLAFERYDPTVDFNWVDDAPNPIMSTDFFSIRWTGYITPRASGTYTFYVTSDDGSILYVGGTEVVYNWGDHGPEEVSGSVVLQAGQSYEIQLVYYEYTGGATVSLMWQGPGISKQVIPAQYLSPEAGSTTPSTPFKGIAAAIPGRVEMEKFDEGGQDIAYVDLFGTINGGTYRPGEEVDLRKATTAKNGWYVRDAVAGEWLQYTVNATRTASNYILKVLYKSGRAGGVIHVELDGVDITGPLTLKATSGYWMNITATGIPITAGEHKVRVVMDKNASNGQVAFFDCMTFIVPK